MTFSCKTGSYTMTHVAARLPHLGAMILAITTAAACQRSPETASATQAPPQTTLGATVALTGFRLIDGTGSAPVENATLVISEGRVREVGAGVQVPAGAQTIDMSGKTVIPGLISAHSHMVLQKSADPKFGEKWFDEHRTDPLEKQFYDLTRLDAEYGVTTVFSLGEAENRGFMEPSDVAALKVFRDSQNREGLDRARVFFVGGPPVSAGAKTGAEARANVLDRISKGANLIKLNLDDDTPPEVYIEAVDEAHKHGLKIVSHLATLAVAKGVIKAHGDAMAHSVRDKDIDAELIALMKSNNAFQIPTLTQEQSNFMWASTPAFVTDPFFMKFAAPHKHKLDVLTSASNQTEWAQSPATANARRGLAQAMRNVKILADAGIPIVMGTDSGGRLDAGRFPGFMEHEEMDLYFQSGMTPMQIIVSATGGAARAMAIDKELGTLQSGKWADFVVLNANPLDHFRNMRDINAVWIAGHPLRAAAGTE